MKNTLQSLTLITVILLLASSVSHAQFRDQELKRSDYSGQVTKKDDPSEGSNLGNLWNMQMNHSYSMNFGSIGGQMVNMNAYTNSMRFFFSEDLTGTVDVSLLHSPFGPSSLYTLNQDDQLNLNVALSAQIDYQINERMNLHFEVNRYPSGYGYGMHSPFNRYNRSPVQSGPVFE